MNNKPKELFCGVWPVLLTPYDSMGKVDFDAYRQMLHWYLEHGVHGLFANCLSSEMHYLSSEDRLHLVSIAVEVAAGQVPVVATCSLGKDIKEHITFSRKIQNCGVDAVILTLPGFCEDIDGLRKYYDQMLEHVDGMLGIYECPIPRPPRSLPVSLVGELARTGRFGPYKETSCSLEEIKQKIQIARGTPLRILQANTALMFQAADEGAHGVMGVIVNILPGLAREAWDAYLKQDYQYCEKLHGYLCLAQALLNDSYPLSAKYLLQCEGLKMDLSSRWKPDLSLPDQARLLLEIAWKRLEIQIDNDTHPKQV